MVGVWDPLARCSSCLLLEACRWLWKINTSVLEGRQFLSSVTEVHSLTVAQGAYLRKWNISTDLCSAVVLHAITGLEFVNCGYLMTRSQTHTHLDSQSPNTFTHILTDTEAYTCTCAISCTHVVLVPQLCSTPWDPMDFPGSSVHGILQARILEWVSIPFSSTHINTYTHPFPKGRVPGDRAQFTVITFILRLWEWKPYLLRHKARSVSWHKANTISSKWRPYLVACIGHFIVYKVCGNKFYENTIVLFSF